MGFLHCTFTWLKSCLLVLISDYVFLFLGIGPAVLKFAKENPEQRTKVIEACSPSETDKNVIRHEVRYNKTQKEIRNCYNNA